MIGRILGISEFERFFGDNLSSASLDISLCACTGNLGIERLFCVLILRRFIRPSRARNRIHHAFGGWTPWCVPRSANQSG